MICDPFLGPDSNCGNLFIVHPHPRAAFDPLPFEAGNTV